MTAFAQSKWQQGTGLGERAVKFLLSLHLLGAPQHYYSLLVFLDGSILQVRQIGSENSFIILCQYSKKPITYFSLFLGKRDLGPGECSVQFLKEPMFNTALIIGYYWIPLCILITLYAQIFHKVCQNIYAWDNNYTIYHRRIHLGKSHFY